MILNRENVQASTQILNSCNQKIFDGYVADISLLNIDYIASKQTKEIRAFIQIINESFTVVGADNKVFELAFNIDNKDLEDTIQYVCASMQKCDVIVSNDKGFYSGEVEVLDSLGFVEKYLL